MEIHGYTQFGSIDATIDGIRMTVPDDIANRHRQMIAEWEAEGNTIPPYVPPEPIPVVRTPALIAMGQVKTADGDISSIAISAALAGAFLFDTGEIWCFFVEEQPDTEYIVLAYDANSVRAYVEDEDKATGYFIIRCTDFDGVPMNPPTLNFEVKRVL